MSEDPVRKAIVSCFGGMGPGSTIWGSHQYDKGFAAGVLAALTAYDTAIKQGAQATPDPRRDAEMKTVAHGILGLKLCPNCGKPPMNCDCDGEGEKGIPGLQQATPAQKDGVTTE